MTAPFPQVDAEKMLPEDHLFIEEMRRSVLLNTGVGIGVGSLLPYAVARQFQASRGARLGATFLGGLGGLAFGVVNFTRTLTRTIGSLPEKSQFKLVASQVLMDRYPMAAAEELENRRLVREAAGKPQ